MSPPGFQKRSAKPCNRYAEESCPLLSLKSRGHKPPNPLLIQDKAFYSLPWNHLALCPVCAAKYHHAHNTQQEIRRRILAARTTEVPIILAREEKTIWFTKVHLLDLQTALREV